ncbi:extracellular solute-binding protein family 1 [Beutenbergia cavernae DSM 12333]|uniref:Extracellular solute-binding protein family 1 n=1 Tax=Beutenbergia cavernae (strain ATCC BAA-8 / DSM 12333 / CCUG 43141 / JCM 11478 / NBRC 16432 / NCIMB 13614 / HKI 0122) TaxID=471853 RepID=C5C5U2_BEUC1|nr:extracellular solute-binding protein [Beutenbergia cavernae]ACQ82300.1 extracellular solute-binding protein family 1 [Beutenbergia cavernae DSM 12333]
MTHLTPRARLVRLTGLAVAVSLLTSACAGAEGSGDAAPTEADDGPVTITFMSWLRNSEAVVEAFNSSQDGIIVEFQTTPSAADNYTTLANSSRAGTAPDVATVEYPYLPDVLAQGLLQPLSEEAADQVAEEFPDAARNLVELGGETWSYPLDLAAWVMYYRADLFEEHGIDVPTTWEEYEQVARQIKDIDPEARIGATTANDPGSLASINWQAGAQWYSADGDAWTVDIDNEVTRQVAEMQQRFVDEDLVWVGEGELLGQRQAAGQTWTTLAGSWNGGYLPVNFEDQAGLWRVALPPSFTGEPTSAGNGGATFAVTADSEHQDAAEAFIAWMTTTEEGIAARVAGGESSVLPANADLVGPARDAFDTSFFGGQDIYAVAAEAAAAIPGEWTWGPAQSTMDTAFQDAIAQVNAGTTALPDIFAPVQETVVESLNDRGIAVD